mgnify:CR=1 FL=1
MSSSSDSDASSSASESDDDSLSPADLAAINAFVGDAEWSDAGSACFRAGDHAAATACYERALWHVDFDEMHVKVCTTTTTTTTTTTNNTTTTTNTTNTNNGLSHCTASTTPRQ